MKTQPNILQTKQSTDLRPCYHSGDGVAKFYEDLWDLSFTAPSIPHEAKFDFTKYSSQHRLFLKQYVYAMMNEKPRTGAKFHKPVTTYQYLKCIVSFYNWLEDNSVDSLQEVTPSLLDEYVIFLKNTSTSTSVVNSAITSICKVYDYRAFILEDNFTFAPWQGRTAVSITGKKNPHSTENRTPRIPEEVSRPLVSWALFYVMDLSDEIIKQIKGQPFEVSIDPLTQEPWRVYSKQAKRLVHEEDALRAACMILILFLTGMRFREAVSIRPGCVEKLREVDGGITLYTLKGKTFKSIEDPFGKDASWVTVEPVARAVEVLEEISKTEFLFTTAGAHAPKYTSSAKVAVLMEHFQRYINKHYANNVRTGFPLYNDEFYHITSGAFRRTLASYIAAQPFGIVAGMIQYKHVQVATFEGYAGTSESGFEIEVQRQTQLARNKDVVELYEQLKNKQPITGPNADRIKREFEPFLAGKVINEKRLQQLMDTKAESLHTGELNDCFYDPNKARCRKKLERAVQVVKDGKDGPVFAACDPTHCACAFIGLEKLPAWQRVHQECEELLATGELDPNAAVQVQKIFISSDKVISTLTKEVSDE